MRSLILLFTALSFSYVFAESAFPVHIGNCVLPIYPSFEFLRVLNSVVEF